MGAVRSACWWTGLRRVRAEKPSHLGHSVFCAPWWGSLSGRCPTSCGSCSSGWCRRRRRDLRRWSASARRPGSAGRDRLRSHVGLYLAAAAVGVVRPVRSDCSPTVLGVVEGQGVGQAPPPGSRRTRRPRRAGLVTERNRLGEHAGPEKGDLTGPNPVDRGKYGSKIHLVTERSGLPVSVGISGANLHDSQALIPLVKGIPPIRSRRGRRRRKPGKASRRQGLRLRPSAAMVTRARYHPPHRP